MKVTLKRIEGLSLAARGDSGHWVAMDTANQPGGNDAGATPMELLLMGLAGCTAIDVLLILGKRRVELDDFTIEVEAERREEHPRKFTKIHLKYFLKGEGIKEKDVQRAIKLSEEKYCSATAALEGGAEIFSSYEISRG